MLDGSEARIINLAPLLNGLVDYFTIYTAKGMI